MPHQLFSDFSWFDFSQKKENAIVDKIDSLMARNGLEMESIIESVVSEFSLKPLVIGEGRFTELQDADLGTSQLANPTQWNFPSSIRPPGSLGKSVTFVVPYTGTRNLLSVRPSSYSGNPPIADVTDADIRITYKESLLHSPETAALVEKFKSYSLRDHLILQQWIATLNQHVEIFNRNIEELATRRFQHRRDETISNQKLLDDLNS